MKRLSSSTFGWLARGGVALLLVTLSVAFFTSDAGASGYSASDSRAVFVNSSVVGCSTLATSPPSGGQAFTYKYNLASNTASPPVADPGSSNLPSGPVNPFSTSVVTNAGTVQTGTGTELDVSFNPASDSTLYTVQAIIVANSGSYNVYYPPETPPTLGSPQHYIAPLSTLGAVPNIVKWNICFTTAPPPVTPEVSIAVALPIAGAAIFGVALFAHRRRRNGLLDGVAS